MSHIYPLQSRYALSTVYGYKTVTNILEKEEFGAKRIDKVKLSDAKEWLIKLQYQDGRSYSFIHTIRGVLRPAFQMAVDDDLLRKNPFQFELVSVIVNDSVTRDAITHDEKRKFLEFVKNASISANTITVFISCFILECVSLMLTVK